jgi:hypothetical protein
MADMETPGARADAAGGSGKPARAAGLCQRIAWTAARVIGNPYAAGALTGAARSALATGEGYV